MKPAPHAGSRQARTPQILNPVDATDRGRRSFVAGMKIETLSIDFTDEQKRYLEGFTSGLQISRAGRGLAGATATKAASEPTGPDAEHFRAQDRFVASGKKLADQEKFKREEHP